MIRRVLSHQWTDQARGDAAPQSEVLLSIVPLPEPRFVIVTVTGTHKASTPRVASIAAAAGERGPFDALVDAAPLMAVRQQIRLQLPEARGVLRIRFSGVMVAIAGVAVKHEVTVGLDADDDGAGYMTSPRRSLLGDERPEPAQRQHQAAAFARPTRLTQAGSPSGRAVPPRVPHVAAAAVQPEHRSRHGQLVIINEDDDHDPTTPASSAPAATCLFSAPPRRIANAIRSPESQLPPGVSASAASASAEAALLAQLAEARAAAEASRSERGGIHAELQRQHAASCRGAERWRDDRVDAFRRLRKYPLRSPAVPANMGRNAAVAPTDVGSKNAAPLQDPGHASVL
jgi:hypothetical protein